MRACVLVALVACKQHGAAPAVHDAPRAPDAPKPAADASGAAADTTVVGPRPMKLAATGDTTCVVMSNLKARCWGATTLELLAVKDLQLAGDRGCALLDDNSVACWTADAPRPVGVLGGAKQLFVQPDRACARLANDKLVCWGNVDAAGHPARTRTPRAPTAVVGLDHVAELSAHAARGDDGRMWWWGDGGKPKLLEASGVAELGEHAQRICGRLGNGSVHCVGSPRCAPPPPPAKPTKKPKGKPKPPVVVEAGEALALPVARQLAFGLGLCVVTTDGELVCGDGCKRVDPPRLTGVERMVDRCAVKRDGAITCFARGMASQAPVKSATSLVVGRTHACAIVERDVKCWGGNEHHQLDYSAAP